MAGLRAIQGGKSETGTKKWASKVRRRCKELAKELDTGYMEMARLLWQVYDVPVDGDSKNRGWFREWGYDSFGDYAEAELGIQQRQAERLKRVVWVLEAELQGLDPRVRHEIIKLGFSKVRELCRVLTVKNAADWVARAQECSYPELVHVIQTYEKAGEKRRDELEAAGEDPDDYMDVDDDEIPPVERFEFQHFKLFEPQAENVRAALQRASELTKSDKKGHNLDMICMDFLATNDFLKADDPKAKARFVAKMERLLGVRLVMIDPDTNDVMYGLDSLEAMAKEHAK